MAGLMLLSGSRRVALWGAEDWVASARVGESSTVAAGAHAGEMLQDVFPEFPLLFKVIDARNRLSVQVHPNERTAAGTGGEPKSEMWCALSDGPIYAGLKSGVSAADVERAVGDGSFEDLLVRHDAKAGDVFYIPGGLVHAIGDGVQLFEVQQSSDTTYRLYDWGRTDADGRPRQLHVAEALAVMDLSLPLPHPCESLDTPYFRFWRKPVAGAETLAAGDGFLMAFAASGEFSAGGIRIPGRSCFLLPPGSEAEVSGNGELMLTAFDGGKA
jgi:mannose-6-phosphate isomerase